MLTRVRVINNKVGMIRRVCFFAAGLWLAVAPLWAQYYKTYTTTADGRRLMAVETGRSAKGEGSVVSVDAGRKYQTMEGFGYAVTYSAAYNLLRMQPSERHAFLVRTFSPKAGYGCSYVRVSIGCSDFSSTEYTLCDTEGLEHFGLQRDETDYVIPVLHEILQINPELKIIAAPWTCPRWMKVENQQNLKPHYEWTAGHLNPKYYADYAQYFVKFVQAMGEQGIPIYAVSPQNEPLTGGNCASLFMLWEEQAEFLKYLAPAFKRVGLKTRIYAFDHNFNYDRMSGQEQYPLKVFAALGDVEGKELVAGSAWHSYGGHPSELEKIRRGAPEKDIIFTEASIGTWNDGRNLSSLPDDFDFLVLGTVNRYCSAVVVWNLMLDLQRGPNLAGGCTTCFGAVDIDENDYRTITPNRQYYMINHIAAVVQPGAVRIGCEGGAEGVNMAFFRNPDGTVAVVAANLGTEDRKVTLKAKKPRVSAPVVVPARSVVSVLLSRRKL